MSTIPVQPIVSLGEDRLHDLARLVEESQADPIEAGESAGWPPEIDRRLPPKRDDQSWIYGTTYWDALDAGQRLELLWAEQAQIFSTLLLLKPGLATLFDHLLEKYGHRTPDPLRRYMNIFREEEPAHTGMFRHYIELRALPLYERPELVDFIGVIEKVHPLAGILCTYLLEGTLEETLRRQEGPHIDPLTRRFFAEHAAQEERHLTFCRWINESSIAMSAPETKLRIGFLVRSFMRVVMPRFTYNPEISKYLSFDLGIDPADSATIDRIRRTENNQRLNQERYGAMLTWIKTLGIVTPAYDWSAMNDSVLPLAHFMRQTSARRPPPRVVA